MNASTSNGPLPHPTLLYYTIPMLVVVMPDPIDPSRPAANHCSTATRYHPYVRAARSNQTSDTPAPIPLSYGYTHPLPSTHRGGPFYTPPHPLDPVFAIHPPMSPREIHRRQQVLRGRRLTALFCIPEFHHIVRSGWVTARWEENRKEASILALAEDSKDDAAVTSQSGDK
ncbi:hypothetical protein H0H92_009875 [Tricholoma furcatifolium]|nr:hypothetical protein H0H92_009875 [Tricholoma furcatifolium]